MKRRLTALLLSLCMVISFFPVTAFADTPTDLVIQIDNSHSHESDEDASYTSPAAITLNLRGGTVVDSGICGENATWTFYSDGTLTISGSGAMDDYFTLVSGAGSIDLRQYHFNNPWDQYRNLITTVRVEDGITKIGQHAFYCSENLTDVSIGRNVTDIGDGSFEYCSDLTTIALPVGVERIGIAAFYECTNLVTVDLPDTLQTISMNAFYNCTSLSDITIPSAVTSIGESAFWHCESLTSIELPNGLTTIGARAFEGCRSAQHIYIPESVTTIGLSAFRMCTSIKTLSVPSSITTIEDNTFSSCIALSSITLPENLIEVGWNAFSGCRQLKDVYFNGTRTTWNSVVIYSDDEDPGNDNLTSATIHYRKYSGSCGANATWTLYDDGVLVISGSGDMYDYTYDSTSAYKAYNDQITSIIVERDITRIGDYAFYNTSATSFTIHNASLSMGTWSVGNNLNLTDIDFGSGVISPANSVFEDCEALKTIHIPSNVIMNGNSSGEGSGYDMFHSCGSLETAIVDCAYVGRYMFETDHKLRTITFTNPDVKIYYVQDDFGTGNPFNSIHGDSGSPVLIDVIGYTCSDVSAMVKVFNQRYNTTSYPYSKYTFVPITNDPGHRGVVEDAAVPATCEETGLTAGSHCTVCDQVIVAQEKTAALGHDYSEPTYSWSEDNSSVTATAVCSHDNSHVVTETVDTTSEVTKEPTATEYGETSYTAVFSDTTFTTQTKTVADIPPVPVKRGDADGNGEVDALDRVLLSQYLAGWPGAAERIVDLNAMDINKDGKVNAKDRMILARYLADWGEPYDSYFKE